MSDTERYLLNEVLWGIHRFHIGLSEYAWDYVEWANDYLNSYMS